MRRVLPALVLVALLVLGLEALRRQTAREFPDASREESLARIRQRVAGIGRWARAPRGDASKGPANAAVAADRLEQLERVGRLRDSGVLDPAEFEREKAKILGPPTVATGGET